MRSKRHHIYHGYDIDGNWNPSPKVDDRYIYRPRPLFSATDGKSAPLALYFPPAVSAAWMQHSTSAWGKIRAAVCDLLLGPQEGPLALPTRIYVSGGIISHYSGTDRAAYDSYPISFLSIGGILERSDKGLRIVESIAGGPLDIAGLHKGDNVLGIKLPAKTPGKRRWLKTRKLSFARMREYIHNAGGPITLQCLRNGDAMAMTLSKRKLYKTLHDIGPFSTYYGPEYATHPFEPEEG